MQLRSVTRAWQRAITGHHRQAALVTACTGRFNMHAMFLQRPGVGIASSPCLSKATSKDTSLIDKYSAAKALNPLCLASPWYEQSAQPKVSPCCRVPTASMPEYSRHHMHAECIGNRLKPLGHLTAVVYGVCRRWCAAVLPSCIWQLQIQAPAVTSMGVSAYEMQCKPCSIDPAVLDPDMPRMRIPW